jgi:PrsW family intramembrane metalloprotease
VLAKRTSTREDGFPMDTPLIRNPSASPPFHWPSLVQLILSLLAALLLLGIAALYVIFGVMQLLNQGTNSVDPTQYFMTAAGLTLASVLTLPSAWYAWRHLAYPTSVPSPRPERRGYGLILTIVVIILVPLALFLGNLISQNSRIAWLLLPPLNLMATGLPVLWLVYIGKRGLSSGSSQRTWGIFASGLVLGPVVILALELAAIIGVVFLAILWVAVNPSLANELSSLASRLTNAAPNQEAILRILVPYLVNPTTLFVAIAFIAVLVPLIEETFKPIGVWFLAGQKLTPAEGFVSGLLCGAGFGLFENLGNTSAGGEIWAVLAATRISTALLHCLTAGLVGWALASAWSQRRYLRLGLTFAFAVLLHGMWNAMAVLSSAGSLETISNLSVPPLLQRIGSLSSIGVVALGVFNFVLYLSFNATLRRSLRSISPLAPPPLVPPESVAPLDSEPIQTPPAEIQEQPAVISASPAEQIPPTPPTAEPSPADSSTDENQPTSTETTP